MALLDKARMVCRVTTTAFDEEITDLIAAGFADLGITDISPAVLTEDAPPLVQRAVLTYVKLNFGEPDDVDRLKESYDEQKAQMATNSDYTNWG